MKAFFEASLSLEGMSELPSPRLGGSRVETEDEVITVMNQNVQGSQTPKVISTENGDYVQKHDQTIFSNEIVQEPPYPRNK